MIKIHKFPSHVWPSTSSFSWPHLSEANMGGDSEHIKLLVFCFVLGWPPWTCQSSVFFPQLKCPLMILGPLNCWWTWGQSEGEGGERFSEFFLKAVPICLTGGPALSEPRSRNGSLLGSTMAVAMPLRSPPPYSSPAQIPLPHVWAPWKSLSFSLIQTVQLWVIETTFLYVSKSVQPLERNHNINWIIYPKWMPPANLFVRLFSYMGLSECLLLSSCMWVSLMHTLWHALCLISCQVREHIEGPWKPPNCRELLLAQWNQLPSG